jgi:signal transduction histidine kinase
MSASMAGTNGTALALADDPYRAVADTRGFGLTCIRERLQAIGGQFTLRSAPGAGTRIHAQAAVGAPP